jgi:hypothetical protein
MADPPPIWKVWDDFDELSKLDPGKPRCLGQIVQCPKAIQQMQPPRAVGAAISTRRVGGGPDKELFTDVTQAERHETDLVARTVTRPGVAADL